MKFEIDDKTGMVLVSEKEILEGELPDLTAFATSNDLEQILQAVKKTQEKLVNIQIQNIQDSKNHWIGDMGRLDSDGKYKDKRDQNQKIVDEIIKNYYNGIKKIHNDLSIPIGSREHLICTIRYLEDMIKYVTGKHIKYLDNNFKSKSGDNMTGNTPDL